MTATLTSRNRILYTLIYLHATLCMYTTVYSVQITPFKEYFKILYLLHKSVFIFLHENDLSIEKNYKSTLIFLPYKSSKRNYITPWSAEGSRGFFVPSARRFRPPQPQHVLYIVMKDMPRLGTP